MFPLRLEIAFKSGQVWQLADVPSGIYAELRNFTISSFLKFIASRYRASPVKTGVYAIDVPKNALCPICQTAMTEQNRTAGALNKFIRVLWLCLRRLPGPRHPTRYGPFRNPISQLFQLAVYARRTQVGFAAAMVRINSRISEPVRGRPGCFGWDNPHQYRLKRRRCQEITVSGRTMSNADFQSCQIIRKLIQNSRS